MKRIKYKDFVSILSEMDYSPADILHLYYEIKKMDPKIRNWFICWVEDGEYPSDRIEGVTVQQLVEEGGMKPINAFIMIDWLNSDPEAAKYAITHLKMPLSIEKANTIPDDMEEPENDDEITCD